MRNLASIQKILKLSPIEGADKIEVAQIKGWNVVTQKGLYKEGDLVVYCEVDSWIPHELAPFLSKDKPRVFQGVEGERLKTIRLRGQISQGLLLPLSVIPNDIVVEEDLDVTEALGILKWEIEVPANLRGKLAGNFPAFLRKTDSERIQNVWPYWSKLEVEEVYVSEKLDGTSCTIFWLDGETRVCSRNFELKLEDNTVYADIAKKVKEAGVYFEGMAIQMELLGPGIQKNIYGLKEVTGYVYDIFSITDGAYVPAKDFFDHPMHEELAKVGFKKVPYLGTYSTSGQLLDEILEFAEGKSMLNSNTEREGIVLKPALEKTLTKGGRFSVKVISNNFLLSH